jgi:hypothetical protein
MEEKLNAGLEARNISFKDVFRSLLFPQAFIACQLPVYFASFNFLYCTRHGFVH